MNDNQSNGAVTKSTLANSPVVKVIGLGSAGLRMLNLLAARGLPPDCLIGVDSDAAPLTGCPAGEKVQLEVKRTRLHGQNGDSAHHIAPEAQLPRLKRLCDGTEVVFIVAGLGGGVGTGLSSVLAAAAAEAGAFVVAFAILPFDCEGGLRGNVAQAGLDRLKETADLVICVSNQKSVTLINAATTLLDAFSGANDLLANTICCAWRALTSETVMGLPFLELCRSLRQYSNNCAMAVAELSGPNRASNALDQLLQHPMLDGLATMPHAEAIAISVLGDPALAMGEVAAMMEQLQTQTETLPVLMGAGVTPALAGNLVVLLLVASTEMPKPEAGLRERPASRPLISGPNDNLDTQLLDPAHGERSHSRFLPPAPALPAEKMAQLLRAQGRGGGRLPKTGGKLRQTQLPLEIISKGRFDKSEPTIHRGEDLDVPTYIRRGVALN